MKFLFYLVTLLFIGILMIFSGHSTLPVSITLPGQIRPVMERTDIISLTSGIIDTIYVHEGQLTHATNVILTLKDYERINKINLLDYEITWRQAQIKDLKLLCNQNFQSFNMNQIKHPALRQQLSHFIHANKELLFSLDKAKKELDMATLLAKEKVIAPKELFDKDIEYHRLFSSHESFMSQQAIQWEQDLELKQQEIKNFESQLLQIKATDYLFEIKAPISGIVQDIHTLYKGSVLQPGQVIGSISPEVDLIAECFATPNNVGLLAIGQQARFQIDAFDYKYFGVLTGKIISIDNDFTTINHNPVYKIRCSIVSPQLILKNGYTGQLKKGMTLTTRLIITERTIWQLLWDNVDDWLNPLGGR